MADLKLTHSIINNRCELVGFVVSGKEKDFGGVSRMVWWRFEGGLMAFRGWFDGVLRVV